MEREGGVGMKGSSTAPADFFVPRAKLFYGYDQE